MDRIIEVLLYFFGGLAIFCFAMAAISGHRERVDFMTECQKSQPKYECVALWRGRK